MLSAFHVLQKCYHSDMGKKLERLDIALVKRGLVESRARAQQLIKAGSVQLSGKVVTKPARRVSEDELIKLLDHLRYVSRGGLKLEAALQSLGLDVSGLTALDVGASTGGFTDCLLQHGVSRVYAVDVGHEQLAPKIRNDPRVQAFEDTDIRQLRQLPEIVDLIVVDVSFISLRLVLPVAVRFLKPRTGRMVVLIKPQYEAGPRKVGKKGVIKDKSIQRETVVDLLQWIQQQGWPVLGLVRSPIQGGEGNVEYFAYLSIEVTPVGGYDWKRVANELFQD